MPTEIAIQIPEAPQTATLEKIRPELNLEKWSVWQPTQSRQPLKTKIFQREITLEDGGKITAKVKIAPTTDGALNTEDQKTYYALVKQWEERGQSSDYTAFSLRGISRFLKKRWGSDAIETISNSLLRLRGTLFTWENSFFDKSTGETIEFLDTFNILSELKIVRRKKDGVVNTEVGYFRFNDFILKNLQSNHTKPVFFDVVVNFKSEIAQLLYTRLDLFFGSNSNKPVLVYERRTKELFEDLGIVGKAYIQRSNRKQKLKLALAELTGVPLSKGGFIASATIEETADRKDFKIVIRKGTNHTHAKNAPTAADEPTDIPASRGVGEYVTTTTPTEVAPASVTPTHATTNQVEALLTHFKTVFADTATADIEPKHKRQAAALISQHGLDCMKFAVDFAHTQAQKTKFEIATFGGIMQYVPAAVSKHTQHQYRQEEAAKREAEAEHRRQLEDAYAQYKHDRITAHIATTYTPDQYQAALAAYTTQMCSSNSMFRNWQPDAVSSYAEKGFRADIAKTLTLASFDEFCSQPGQPAPSAVTAPPPRPDEL